MSEWLKNNKITIGVIIGVTVITTGLFAYVFWYNPSEEITERVRIIANIGEGCIAETYDDFFVNIGPCDAFPGDVIVATYKIHKKERSADMNFTK